MCTLFNAAASREIDFYVQLLDGNKKAFSIAGNQRGQDLLRAVLNSINVPEQQFFGLKYSDSRKNMQWMNCRKTVYSMVKSCRGGLSDLVGEKSCQLFLAIRFYPNDPCRELSEATRLQVFLQVIQDIQTGSVIVPRDKAPRLAALMLQSHHGDFDHQRGFPLNNYDLFSDLRPGIDTEVTNMYRMFKGLPASQAEYQFLSHVKWLDGYGRAAFRVTLENDAQSILCIETTGVILRDQATPGGQTCFFWPRIKRFLLKKHRVVMKVRSKSEDGVHEFRTDDKYQLQNLWETCCEHLEFFRSGIDPSFRQAQENPPAAAMLKRPGERARRRELVQGGWQQQQQQQFPLQPLPPHQPGSQNRRLYAPPAMDTRSMRDIRAPVASTSSVYADDPYRPFMSDSEAVTKTSKINMIRDRYYQRSSRHLGSDELYDSSEAGFRNNAGRHAAARAPATAASRSRRPVVMEASSELLNHIRHDRVDSNGLTQEQRRRIDFTQLPADRGVRVTYDAQAGRGHLRLMTPRAEILPRSSAPVPPDLDAEAAAAAYEASSQRQPAGRLQQPATAAARTPPSVYASDWPSSAGVHRHSGEGPYNFRHSHNNSYQAAVSDTEVSAQRRFKPVRGQHQQPALPPRQLHNTRIITSQQTLV